MMTPDTAAGPDVWHVFGVMLYVFLAPAVGGFIAAVTAARRDRSKRDRRG